MSTPTVGTLFPEDRLLTHGFTPNDRVAVEEGGRITYAGLRRSMNGESEEIAIFVPTSKGARGEFVTIEWVIALRDGDAVFADGFICGTTQPVRLALIRRRDLEGDQFYTIAQLGCLMELVP